MNTLENLNAKLSNPNAIESREWLLELKAKQLFQLALPNKDVDMLKEAIACLDEAYTVLSGYFEDKSNITNPYRRERDFFLVILDKWQSTNTPRTASPE